MNNLNKIKSEIKEGRLEEAIHTINHQLALPNIAPEEKSELYYLLGNAHRKKNDFHLAMYNYTMAIDEQPDSPAVEALEALQQIMSFYNKDMYNH